MKAAPAAAAAEGSSDLVLRTAGCSEHVLPHAAPPSSLVPPSSSHAAPTSSHRQFDGGKLFEPPAISLMVLDLQREHDVSPNLNLYVVLQPRVAGAMRARF